MTQIDQHPSSLVSCLINAKPAQGLCILDSCGDHLDSQWLLAGISPSKTYEISNTDPNETLRIFDEILSGDKIAIFSISYDLGRKLENIGDNTTSKSISEPDLFISTFDSLVVHDYLTGRTSLIGNRKRVKKNLEILRRNGSRDSPITPTSQPASVTANFSRAKYLETIETIKEYIRRGDTYQTNLTQQITASLPTDFPTAGAFQRIRKNYPAPFTAYLERPGSMVVSASPERFFRVINGKIQSSPIKGTRPRGLNKIEDRIFREQLLASEKDRAENTMIVDLMRNDLGRICEYGSIEVSHLCRLQELSTLFHLVSDVEGTLRREIKPSDIIRALFPCGSITGAPKIRTMQIIDELEPSKRGLSMGAIGLYIPEGFGLPPMLDLSVAIRTMVIREGKATFNVGGGIVIDSNPEAEYEESLLKAQCLLGALGCAETISFSSATSGS
ncbi:MAG TPA: aminodeoxychorismate synthase component I [Pyrinomonadaceae bacterium]|nr:aminodeoxychorismate synthase component I [Pyrinomonadaceae bacterium]